MTISYRQPDALKDTLLEDLIGEAIQEGFEPLGDSLVNSLKAAWPEDTGKSRKSIRKRISGNGFKTRMLIYASAATAALRPLLPKHYTIDLRTGNVEFFSQRYT
jgi:hypothetical protein